MSENCKKMKWERLARCCLALVMVVVLLFGNVGRVHAWTLICPSFNTGEVLNLSFYTTKSDSEGVRSVTLESSLSLKSNSSPVYCFYAWGRRPSDDSFLLYLVCVSNKTFNVLHSYDDNSDGIYPEISGSSSSYSASQLNYNEISCYYKAVPVVSHKSYSFVGSGIPALCFDDFGVDLSDSSFVSRFGPLVEYAISCDFVFAGEGGSSAPDFSGGAFDTSLGSLSGLKADTYVQKSDSVLVTPMTLGVDEIIREKFTAVDYERDLTWSNVHKEWDDSYQVALYRKMFVRKKSLLTIGDLFSYGDIVAESELCFVDSVPYASCNASYVATKAVNDEFQTLFDKYSLIGHEFFYHDYLIIYHESDDGVVYGYWNVIPSFGEEVTYGTLNSKGKYDSVGKIDGGDIESDVYLGDSIESSKDDNPYFDDGLSDSVDDNQDNVSNMFSRVLDMVLSVPTYLGKLFKSFGDTFASVGQIPQQLANMFQFLPPEVISCISFGVVALVLLRILGR